MPSPSVFKSAPFLGTTGAVGAAGVCVTGWQLLGNGNGIPDASALGLNTSSIRATIDGSYGCFSSFFEGVEFPKSSSKDTLSNLNSFTNVQPPTPQGGENPAGCMIMQLSYDVNDTTNPRWVFKGEITIKSGNIGWALWLAGYGGKSEGENLQYGQKMDHKLVFLEKKGESSWEIKTGLGWKDWITYTDFSVQIADPNGNVWINENVKKEGEDAFAGFKTEPKSKVYSYSGVWGVQEPGNEVFKDVNIFENGDDGGIEIFLGREDGFGSDIDPHYIYDGGNWRPINESNAEKVKKEDLNKWYVPFKGKKGKWS